MAEVRTDVRLEFLGRVTKVAWLSGIGLALILYYVLITTGGSTVVRVGIGLIVTAAVYRLGGWWWGEARTYAAAAIGNLVFAAALASSGLLLSRAYPGAEVVTPGLFAAPVALVLVVTGSLGYLAIRAYCRQRVTRRHAQAILACRLAELVSQASKARTTAPLAWRRNFMLWRLEVTARLLERDVLKQIPVLDSQTAKWLGQRLTGAGESLRNAKKHVLSPTGASWDHLYRLLNQQLTAVATSNWGNLAWRKPATEPPRSRGQKALNAARLIAIAVLPVASLGILGIWIRLDTALLSWIWIAAVLWAVVTVLSALDPAVRDKIETIRSIATLARESPDRGGASHKTESKDTSGPV